MKTIFKKERINAYANLLLNNGFDLLIPNNPETSTYFHFSKDNKIGYCQLAYNNWGISFSSVHKPCRECGTGFGFDDSYTGVESPTIEDAEKTFIIAPNWAKPTDRKAVRKWNDFDDYIKNSFSGKDGKLIKSLKK